MQDPTETSSEEEDVQLSHVLTLTDVYAHLWNPRSNDNSEPDLMRARDNGVPTNLSPGPKDWPIMLLGSGSPFKQ